MPELVGKSFLLAAPILSTPLRSVSNSVMRTPNWLLAVCRSRFKGFSSSTSVFQKTSSFAVRTLLLKNKSRARAAVAISLFGTRDSLSAGRIRDKSVKRQLRGSPGLWSGWRLNCFHGAWSPALFCQGFYLNNRSALFFHKQAHFWAQCYIEGQLALRR